VETGVPSSERIYRKQKRLIMGLVEGGPCVSLSCVFGFYFMGPFISLLVLEALPSYFIRI
jgi:hypothetical protein